jgi:hypothetical protein
MYCHYPYIHWASLDMEFMPELLHSWLQSSLTSKNLKVQSKGNKKLLKGTNDKVTIAADNEILIKVMIHLETLFNKLEF